MDIAQFEKSYIKELMLYDEILQKRRISSIFFGGGTPSLSHPRFIDNILSYLQKHYFLDKDIEITMEANPTSVESDKFAILSKIGVNRVSIGIQSFNEKSLKFLGREHNAHEAKKAIELANNYFQEYSFDLIYALPGQTMIQWHKELEEALPYCKNHISLYQLTIEKGTEFFKMEQQKSFIMPSQNASAKLYLLTDKIMKGHGFQAYEVSNYAKNNSASKHNMNYWRYGDYIGIGPGAHGRFMNQNHQKISTITYYSPAKWHNDIATQGRSFQQYEVLSEKVMLQEKIIMGLRLRNEGIDLDLLNHEKAQSMIKMNFLEIYNNLHYNKKMVRPTINGTLLLNSLIEHLCV